MSKPHGNTLLFVKIIIKSRRMYAFTFFNIKLQH